MMMMVISNDDDDSDDPHYHYYDNHYHLFIITKIIVMRSMMIQNIHWEVKEKSRKKWEITWSLGLRTGELLCCASKLLLYYRFHIPYNSSLMHCFGRFQCPVRLYNLMYYNLMY